MASTSITLLGVYKPFKIPNDSKIKRMFKNFF